MSKNLEHLGHSLSCLVPGHEQSQDIPKEKCDGSKEFQGCADILIFTVVMHDLRCVVKDPSPGQRDHTDGEPSSELKAKEGPSHNRDER